MAGFDNDVVYGANVDFRGVSPVVGQVTTNGQLLIGSTVFPNIRVGNLTSIDNSVTITSGAGTIDLSTNTTPLGPTFSNVTLFDDFFALQVSTSGGYLGWINTGWGGTTTTDNAHPGILTSNTLTTIPLSQFYCILRTGNNTNLILGNVDITYNTVLKIGNLSLAPNTYKFIVGLTNDAGSPTDGVYFSYTDSESGGNWQINCTKASATTSANSLVAVQTLNFVNLGITINQAGTAAHFFINGVEVNGSPIIADIPTAAITPCYSLDSFSGTIPQATFQIDLFYLNYILGSSRAAG